MEKTENILSSLKFLIFDFQKPRVMMEMTIRLTDKQTYRQTVRQTDREVDKPKTIFKNAALLTLQIKHTLRHA